MKMLEKIGSKIEPFIVKYIWKEIHYPSGKDDWKRSDKKNPTIALNVLYIKKNIYKLKLRNKS